MHWIPNYLHLLGLIKPLSIFLVKLIPCQNIAMNNVPYSSIMAVSAVTISTLFVSANLSSNAVTDHNCYFDDTVGRQLKALSVSFIQFLVTSRVLKITNSYVHQPSLQASKASKLHIRLQPKVHHEDRSAANQAPF